MTFRINLPYDIYSAAVRAYFDRTHARTAKYEEIVDEYSVYGWVYVSPSKIEQDIVSSFSSEKHATMFILRFMLNDQ